MPNDLQIIPVIDILNGIVVQAIAGERAQYQPLRSQLTDSVDPSIVLARMCDVCQSNTAYVADLDGILHQQPNQCILAELGSTPTELMVDLGVRSSEHVQTLLDMNFSQAIVALESLPGPDIAADLLQTFDSRSLILSVDMKYGLPVSCWEPWSQLPALDLMQELAGLGFQRWILLDLSAVGMHNGVPTLELCRAWRMLRPYDEIITGGGIRNRDDVEPLKQAGVDAVLVASAVHAGSILESPASDR